MVGFSRLQVSGYRRLRNLDLALRPMNVLIGANGVGKSSVLEVVSLLAHSADGRLQDAISRAGGISSLLTQDGRTRSIKLSVNIPNEHVPFAEHFAFDYDLELGLSGIGYAILGEKLVQAGIDKVVDPIALIDIQFDPGGSKLPEDRGAAKLRARHNFNETLLSHNPDTYQVWPLRDDLRKSDAIYHTLDISIRAPVRLPQPLQPASTPAPDGSLLLACLYMMRETQRDRFEAVEDALRAAFPNFQRLDLPAVAAGTITMAWKDRDFTGILYPHQLSEGTLRFLWLATLLQSPGLPPVTLIDEPEVSLHPEMLRLLLDLMREASERTQLIIATHSDRFVRFLLPDDLVICDLTEDGSMQVKRGGELDLAHWLDHYALDELWSKGVLGGRS